MYRVVNLASRAVDAFTRGNAGRVVVELGDRPAEPLVLYDVEGCPYCRPVREALTMLDLPTAIRPCPIGGRRFAAELAGLGGDGGVPVLVDPNRAAVVHEADHIVHHLFRHYGRTEAPTSLVGPAARLTAPLRARARAGHGTHARPSRAPDRPLELWSFEACPWCRRVRERLTELELPYLLHPMGKGSPGRPDFLARTGRTQFPYLEDPNTGAAMFESADICSYLERTWGAPA